LSGLATALAGMSQEKRNCELWYELFEDEGEVKEHNVVSSRDCNFRYPTDDSLHEMSPYGSK
jgi:hypothetical protein